jgi:lipopolysaccharide biosynthesis glycosyltransferase
VLFTGLDVKVTQAIERDVAGRVRIEWLEVDPDQLKGASHTVGLSRATNFRLLLPDLLPSTMERTIYLDADTLVLRPLTELWHTDLDGNMLAAVRDAGAPYAAGPSGTEWRRLGIAPSASYFNAGLLVLPLVRWRREGISAKVLDLLRGSDLPWGDQDALNIVAANQWKEIPRRWNLQSADADERSLSWALWRSDVEDAIHDPAIVHYTETEKPWRGKVDHPYADPWFEVLSRSSWAGWTQGRPSKVARAGDRMARAWRVLRFG